MAERFSGDLKINVRLDDRLGYFASVSRGGRLLWRGRMGWPPAGRGALDSPKAYDEAAHAALSFANDEVRGLGASAETDDMGWKIRRVPRFHQQYPAGSSRRPARFSRRDQRRGRSA